MVLRVFLRYLANNEYIIDKLATSKLFRKTAQLTVFILYRTKLSKVTQISSDPQKYRQQLVDALKRFSNNLQKEIEEAKRNVKK